VGGFQSSVRLGAGIQFTTSLEGFVFPCSQPATISWTGGDPNAWVTLSVGAFSWQARVSDGSLTRQPPFPDACSGVTLPTTVVVEVDPDPSETPAFLAPGLSLGGPHLWKYTYTFDAFVGD
jgi:hypothetical protein